MHELRARLAGEGLRMRGDGVVDSPARELQLNVLVLLWATSWKGARDGDDVWQVGDAARCQ